MREDLGVDHVAFALLARLVHGLWGQGTKLSRRAGESTALPSLPAPTPGFWVETGDPEPGETAARYVSPPRGTTTQAPRFLFTPSTLNPSDGAEALPAAPPRPRLQLTCVSLTVAVFGARGLVRVMVYRITRLWFPFSSFFHGWKMISEGGEEPRNEGGREAGRRHL